jgi:flagellar protein FlaJ
MAREMDALLPYAVNFVAAMAAANATPQKIFRSLAIQENIYGSISKDAGWIYRDTAVLGMDMLTALKRSVKRAPSDKYKEFIQGVINTLTSGGNMKSYFQNRAEFYMRLNRRDQEQFLETLAFMAESYVVVAVAMPIFLIVILVIMYWVSGSGMQIGDIMLYAVIFGLLPMIHVGYIATIYLITPKV